MYYCFVMALEKIKGVFLEIGPERFLLHEDVKKKKAASAVKYGDFAVQSFSFPETSVSSLRSEFFAPAFLSEKRILFISGLPWGASDKISDDDKESLLKLLDSFSRLPENVVLFFISEAPDKRTKFFKTLSALSQEVYSFPSWDPEKERSAYVSWVTARANKYHSRIDPATATFFLEYSGFDLEILDTELQKLAMRRYGESIQKQDILDLAVPSEESVDFAFSNALSSAQLSNIFQELHTLFEDFTAPEVFNRDILPAFRNALKSAISKEKGADLGLHPFVMKKLIPLIKKYPLETWQKLYIFLQELDLGSKQGRYPLSPDARIFITALERTLAQSLL